jgi:hypothetical protein
MLATNLLRYQVGGDGEACDFRAIVKAAFKDTLDVRGPWLEMRVTPIDVVSNIEADDRSSNMIIGRITHLVHMRSVFKALIH